MTTLQVTAGETNQRPNYKKTAAALLERCREFYRDPENEKAFQKWKAQRSAGAEKSASA